MRKTISEVNYETGRCSIGLNRLLFVPSVYVIIALIMAEDLLDLPISSSFALICNITA